LVLLLPLRLLAVVGAKLLEDIHARAATAADAPLGVFLFEQEEKEEEVEDVVVEEVVVVKQNCLIVFLIMGGKGRQKEKNCKGCFWLFFALCSLCFFCFLSFFLSPRRPSASFLLSFKCFSVCLSVSLSLSLFGAEELTLDRFIRRDFFFPLSSVFSALFPSQTLPREIYISAHIERSFSSARV